MDDPRRPTKFSKNAGRIAGWLIAALLLLALAVVVSRLVVRWCPHGDNCAQIAQLMFWTGIAVSVAVSISVGAVARGLVDRWIARRPS